MQETCHRPYLGTPALATLAQLPDLRKQPAMSEMAPDQLQETDWRAPRQLYDTLQESRLKLLFPTHHHAML